MLSVKYDTGILEGLIRDFNSDVGANIVCASELSPKVSLLSGKLEEIQDVT